MNFLLHFAAFCLLIFFGGDLVMRNTSLCYIENSGRYLMLHRVKKENDENRDKWIGIGGKFEPAESPHDCALREIYEETGLSLSAEALRHRGIVTFVSDEWGTEYMHLFTACVESDLVPVGAENSEGKLEWVPIESVTSLPIWEGDRIFLSLLASGSPFFSLKLSYCGDKLTESILYPQ